MSDPTVYQRAAFGQDLEEWRRIVDTMGQDEDLEARKIGSKIHDCCRWPALYVATDRSCLIPCEARCRSRLCPRCGKSRARAAIARLSDLVDVMDSPRMLTLTITSTDEHLGTQLRRLTEAFQGLRKQADWRAHVLGGVYTIEVTLNHRTGRWHPHLHALIDGRYWAQADIKAAWLKASKTSSIVHIQLCRGRTSAARYMAEYIGKTSAAQHVPADRLHEWWSGTKGVRMLQTWGTLHGLTLESEDEPPKPKMERVTGLLRLAMAAADGQQRARELWDRVHDRTLHLAYDGDVAGKEARVITVERLCAEIREWEANEVARLSPTLVIPDDVAQEAAARCEQTWLWGPNPPPSALIV